MALERGPLPEPSEGGRHEIHADCAGAGCGRCCGTGYRTMGRAAIESLKARILALLAALPPEDLDALKPSPVPSGRPKPPESPPSPPPAVVPDGPDPGPPAIAGQLAFCFED